VQILRPREGARFKTKAKVVLIAEAADPDGEIAGVQFFANGELLGLSSADRGENPAAETDRINSLTLASRITTSKIHS
jgi:hypothetical protein